MPVVRLARPDVTSGRIHPWMNWFSGLGIFAPTGRLDWHHGFSSFAVLSLWRRTATEGRDTRGALFYNSNLLICQILIF